MIFKFMAKRKAKIKSVSSVTVGGKKRKKSIHKKYVPKDETTQLVGVPEQYKVHEEKLKRIGLRLHVIERLCENDVKKYILVVLKKKKLRYHSIWASGNWAMPEQFQFEDFFKSETYKEHMASGFTVSD